jgi:dienelactone hydrolase
MNQGEGAHPPADACDFARFCSALDFWSINDHAEGLTPRRWSETKESIRQCNAVAGDARDPDVVAYLGWEWTQVGLTPQEHYGHKNVIFRDLADDAVPTRPIASAGLTRQALRRLPRQMLLLALLDFPKRQRYFDFARFAQELGEVSDCPAGVDARELPEDCLEATATAGELFEKLSQWGFDTIVIPHGTSWGMYTPPGSTWDHQLSAAQHDPGKQTLVEVFSGHGNSEEYRDWRAVEYAADGSPRCPEPRGDYLPSCWQAGEIIRERCEAADLGTEECERRAAEARQHYAQAGVAGRHAIPGEKIVDWLDAGQCRDCFLPAFNFRPGGSVQYMTALTNFDDPARPRRFRFGFIASSDNHTARPGTGYKEVARGSMSDRRGPRDETWHRRRSRDPGDPEPRSIPFDPRSSDLGGFQLVEFERQTSFFLTGGLVAVHATGRDRDAVWDAMKRREVYATSGERILLWFDLLNAPGHEGSHLPMGAQTTMAHAPRFEVRAVGAFEQLPGCPQYSTHALSADELERLCRGECYNPSDARREIRRIEVVRIRPQQRPGEPLGALIEDPWRSLPCEPDPAGCSVVFEDPEFPATGRDTVYYVRAVEGPSLAVNAANLRCDYDAEGNCVRANPCWGDYRTDYADDCLAENQERAWSSPIYVDFAPPGSVERMASEHTGDRPLPSGAVQAPAAPVTTERVDYATLDGRQVSGYLARPADAPASAPGLIVIHEWWGLNDNIRAMAERLAGEGYVALAVDLYEGETAEDPERARELATATRERVARLRDNLRQARAYLAESAGASKVGAIGWCFGGGWSLDTALQLGEGIDAAVIYYGRLVTDEAALAALRAPVLGIFGSEDRGIPVESVRAFETALERLGKAAEVHVYEGADHAFANPSGTRYDARAAGDAWARTMAFLRTQLQ